MLLLLMLQAPVNEASLSTTLFAVGGSILASVVVNRITTRDAMNTAIAEFKGAVVTDIKNIKEDIVEVKKTNGDQWEKINKHDQVLVEIRTTCNNKHGNGKAHHA